MTLSLGQWNRFFCDVGLSWTVVPSPVLDRFGDVGPGCATAGAVTASRC
jgi:hypothetical protein